MLLVTRVANGMVFYYETTLQGHELLLKSLNWPQGKTFDKRGKTFDNSKFNFRSIM